MKKNETYSLSEQTIQAVKEFADKYFGNKSKVAELAITEFLERRAKEEK